MTAIEFWKKFGTPKARELCGMAGTKFEYFEHIAHGRKSPSAGLAQAISDASEVLTGERIDAASMRTALTAENKREAARRARAEAFALARTSLECAGAV